METTTMTVEQGLEEIIRNLNSINVPVMLLEQIGLPIRQCVNNLQLCIDAINRPAEEDSRKENGYEDVIDLGELEEVLNDGETEEK